MLRTAVVEPDWHVYGGLYATKKPIPWSSIPCAPVPHAIDTAVHEPEHRSSAVPKPILRGAGRVRSGGGKVRWGVIHDVCLLHPRKRLKAEEKAELYYTQAQMDKFHQEAGREAYDESCTWPN